MSSLVFHFAISFSRFPPTSFHSRGVEWMTEFGSTDQAPDVKVSVLNCRSVEVRSSIRSGSGEGTG